MIGSVAAAVAALSITQPMAEWRSADTDFDWSFPADHGSHAGFKTEWWYFTGQLVSVADTSHRFGYQFTIFRVGVVPQAPNLESAWSSANVIMGHAAITDFRSGRHTYSETLYRETPTLGQFGTPSDSIVAWMRAPPGTADRWTLRWTGVGFDLAMRDDAAGWEMHLSTREVKPLVLHGPNGYSRKASPGNHASMYYSMTRLQTTGSVRVGDAEIDVRGTSWMDHEFGSNQLAAHQRGWDWFSVQLLDGRDLMLFMLRDSTGAVDFASGTAVDAAGRTTDLSREDFSIAVTDRWRSNRTAARYPSRWTVTVPSMDLRVTLEPAVADQENVSERVPDLFYWEGAVVARTSDGSIVGRGYVELTGYGTSLRPAL